MAISALKAVLYPTTGVESFFGDVAVWGYIWAVILQFMNIEKYITSDPKVMLGKPVVKGTRITVELILEKISEGETIEDIIEAHPHISREAILAAVAFAAKNLKADTIYPIAA